MEVLLPVGASTVFIALFTRPSERAIGVGVVVVGLLDDLMRQVAAGCPDHGGHAGDARLDRSGSYRCPAFPKGTPVRDAPSPKADDPAAGPAAALRAPPECHTVDRTTSSVRRAPAAAA
ncbi:hypothetical protein [Streptomyces sp. NPDC048481]|uniref:hypothetical protein n=1 Tax=Streptomyces sp. NPDC048481 TaxID=3365557 RepID=UPI00372400EF